MPKRKTLLICGATGFIGRNLVLHYQKQAVDIIAVWHSRPSFATNDNVRWVQVDLRDPQQVNEIVKDVDIIIQAAATTSGAKDIVNSPYLHVTDNAVMNSYLLRASYELAIEHFIFFSCTIMYPSLGRPVVEEDFNGEITEQYFAAGSTKVYLEDMCKFYSGLAKTKYTVIRHSNIYGPFDKFDLERSHVFGATVTKVMLANSTFSVWGNGEQIRDFLHVDDLIHFVDLSISKQQTNFQLYNCGSEQPMSIKNLIKIMITEANKDLVIKFDLTQPSIHFDLVLNCQKAKADLDWQPRVDLRAGIRHTLNWWQDNIDPKTLTLISSNSEK